MKERIFVKVTPEEKAQIRQRMKDMGVTNMSAYMRKMAIDGYCVKLDLTDVKEMVRLLRYSSNNLNQYAKKANESGSIYAEDIHDLQVRFEELWKIAKEILARLAGID